ncbi:MAG: pyridoxal phosphate-dependent aminotransferase [Candidatus Glassbacteria bacterium]|nr:pyridoxal phosphate-dependent aminotransferase [Candidatus Glassbacteria bacterium]
MSVSQCVSRIEPSITLAITAKAKAMKAEGIDVVGLSAGEPDFDTPDNIKQAAIKAINDGFTKYTPAVGIPPLRQAIAEKFKKDNGLDYALEQVIVNCGAKHSVFLAVMALVDPGDEVIIPAPYWVSYPEMTKAAGGTPVIVETTAESEYKITAQQLKDATTPKSRLLILNSPSNPSGMVYSRQELTELAEVLRDSSVYVISDEIYEKILYDGAEHVSIATLDEEVFSRTIVINGASKCYSMTGWRIGYAAGPLDVIKGMGKLQSQETSNPTSISQVAALEALQGPQDSVAMMVRAFDERRKYLVGRLNSIDGVSCIMPRGAFYAFPDFSAYHGRSADGKKIGGSVGLSDYLLEKSHVAVVPGGGFGLDANQRLSYATSMEMLEKALDRIEEGLAALS